MTHPDWKRRGPWSGQEGWGQGRWEGGPPPWHGASRRTRRLLFFRLLAGFGLVALLFLGGMAILAWLINTLVGGDGQAVLPVWIAGCGLALALPMVAAAVAGRAFRRIATPLADVMAAADAVAEGDLSVRLPEYARGEFAQLARSFNRMAGELELADRRRRNLTADVAHELRTPLQIIQGNLEGVLDGVYEPTPAHVESTLAETRALARLVEDLRTLSLAEAGQLALEMEPLDVAELLADTATSFGGPAAAAGVELQVEVAPGLPVVAGDPGRLGQVLDNLVANALRHTPGGGRIRLAAGNGQGGVRLVVADTGEGIPAEDLPYVFDRFWKGDRARSHAGGAGSGLGLAIARELVHAHGGRIEVTSEVGQGTTFVILLPAAQPGPQPLQTPFGRE